MNLDKIAAHLDRVPKSFKGKEAQVGYFPGAKYEDGTPVAYVASIHEFGAPSQNIPPRPTMSPAVNQNGKEWAQTLAKGAGAVSKGQRTGADVLELVGMQAVGDIKKQISQITLPALKPATIKARMRRRADRSTVGSLDKPLVDTGTMLASVSNVVADK